MQLEPPRQRLPPGTRSFAKGGDLKCTPMVMLRARVLLEQSLRSCRRRQGRVAFAFVPRSSSATCDAVSCTWQQKPRQALQSQVALMK